MCKPPVFMNVSGALLIFSSLLPAPALAHSEIEQKLQLVLNAFIVGNPNIPGVMVTFESDQLNIHWQGSAGIDNRETNKPIAPEQPLRLASITKTYVAAAILRLMELGKLSLDDPLSEHLSQHQLEILKLGDYRPDNMSIRHLLTHTSGLWDFAQSEYFGVVGTSPDHRWTRDEQLKFAMDHGEPYGEPGEFYRYSDTGYILLGEIIERRSGLGLAPALRKMLTAQKEL